MLEQSIATKLGDEGPPSKALVWAQYRWECKTLVVGTGMYGKLPVVKEFEQEAKRRGVKLVILKTKEAVKYFLENYGPDLNAIFHITC